MVLVYTYSEIDKEDITVLALLLHSRVCITFYNPLLRLIWQHWYYPIIRSGSSIQYELFVSTVRVHKRIKKKNSFMLCPMSNKLIFKNIYIYIRKIKYLRKINFFISPLLSHTRTDRHIRGKSRKWILIDIAALKLIFKINFWKLISSIEILLN